MCVCVSETADRSVNTEHAVETGVSETADRSEKHPRLNHVRLQQW